MTLFTVLTLGLSNIKLVSAYTKEDMSVLEERGYLSLSIEQKLKIIKVRVCLKDPETEIFLKVFNQINQVLARGSIR